MNAITDGDSSVWSPHLSAQWFLTDEEDQRLNRGEFLAGLRGLPKGQSGKLRITRRYTSGTRDVAVLSYDIDEWHDFHGHELETVFHATDTWIRERGRWQMIASQVTALPTPIAGRAVDRRLLEAYVGEYAMATDITVRVVVGDSGLSMVRPERPPQRLYALDDRIFIRHGIRGFWVFERDSVGPASEVVNWRDNNAVRWRRVKSGK